MNRTLQTWVNGLGIWTPGLPNWAAWQALCQGSGTLDDTAPARPQPARLAAGERRRVSTHVLAAIEVADQAVAMSGHDGGELPCIFASAYGDLGIMDYMCAVLADTPQHLSPTRFHNSVHNAAAGYWTIASHCHAGSQAIAAAQSTFGAGLLEAAVLARADDHPVLLVVHDDPGSGPLAEAMHVDQSFACALVLSPHASAANTPRLDLALVDNAAKPTPPQHPFAAHLTANNPSAKGLALLEALATGATGRVTLAAAPNLGLDIAITRPL
ncbi:MAG TPA: beta-ketoacyl synthase chain length factor [Rhodanobacteraceae bacterium]